MSTEDALRRCAEANQRHQERIAALERENAALREIARGVDAIGRDATGAIVEDSLYVSNCPLCHRRITGPDLSEFGGERGHADYCPVTKARALLGD